MDDPAEVKGFGEIKKGFGEIKTRKRKQIKKTKINFDDPAEVKGFGEIKTNEPQLSALGLAFWSSIIMVEIFLN